jgi:hypothetical protein
MRESETTAKHTRRMKWANEYGLICHLPYRAPVRRPGPSRDPPHAAHGGFRSHLALDIMTAIQFGSHNNSYSTHINTMSQVTKRVIPYIRVE